MADNRALISEEDMGVDEDGEDVFLPTKMEEEQHKVSFTEKFSNKKSKRCIWFIVLGFGAAIFIILLGVAIAVTVEFTILKKDAQPPRDFNATTSAPATSVPQSTSKTASTPSVSQTTSQATAVTPTPSSMEWWKTTIIYQIYPRSYQDSDGDGNGDLVGIINRVGYVNSLGVKTIWLSPVFKSPQRDNGYDISNYTDIDPLFGNLADLTMLLNELHSKGMHLLLDFVPNHTSDEHPWFVESRQSMSSSKRDWYVWADGRNNGSSPPNNWIAVFGGSAWTKCNITGQYYLHQFSEFQPDLNYSNREVVLAIENVLQFWLNRGVDGFRIDAVAHLLEDPQLRDEPINPNHGQDCGTGCYDYLIHSYTRNYMGIHDVIRGWRKVLDSYPGDRFMVGEVYESVSTLTMYYGQNLDEFNFPFNFFLLTNNNWTGINVDNIVKKWLTNMPPGGWPNWVLGNHDNHRIASKAPQYLARALNVLLLTLPGTPTTYYGEEIMMTNVDVPDSQRQDLYGDRDKERTPMQWTSGPQAGFTNSSNPWLPISDNYTTVNVQVEINDKASMLTLYRALAGLRTMSAFTNSGYATVMNSTEVLAYVRQSGGSGQNFMVVINFSVNYITVDLSSAVGFPSSVQIYLSTTNRTGSVTLSQVSLDAGEALVFHSSIL